MRFSKFNNPSKKRKNISRKPSKAKQELKEDMFKLIALAKSEEEREAIIKAYSVSVRPYF